MKKTEKYWIKWIIFFVIFNAFWVFAGEYLNFFPYSLCMIHVFNVIILALIYSVIQSKRTRSLEKKLPKIGKECFGYIYKCEANDNNSIIYHVIVYTEENEMKILRYRTFTNLKLRCNQIVKGYYLKEKIVLEKKNTDIKDLPQNIIDAFELNNENSV